MTDLELLAERIFAAYTRPAEHVPVRPALEQRVRWILQHIPEGGIAEVGCGNGLLSLLLAVHERSALGVDPDPDAIAFAEARRDELPEDLADRVRFRAGDPHELPAEDGSFAAVVIGEQLAAAPDQAAVVDELIRVLEPGGAVILTVPSHAEQKDRPRHAMSAFRPLLERAFDLGEVALTGDHLTLAARLKPEGERRQAAARDATTAELRARIDALQRQVDAGEAAIQRAERLRLEDQLAAADQRRELEQTIEDLRATLALAKSTPTEGDEGGSSAREALMSLSRSWADRLGEANDRLADTFRRLNEVTAELAAANERLRASDGEIELLSARVHELDAALETATGRHERDAAMAELERVRRDFARRERELNEARARAERAAGESRTEIVHVEPSDPEVAKLQAERDKLRAQVDRIVGSRAWGAIVRYRYLRHGKVRQAFATRKPKPQAKAPETAKAAPPAPKEEADEPADQPRVQPAPARPALPELKIVPPSDAAVVALTDGDDQAAHAATRPSEPERVEQDDSVAALEAWIERARAAESDEVVLMFSGTIHIQEERGNRPIRLTREYLDRGVPTFFNYWRWRTDDPSPEFEHPLLLQSPIDITPKLLQRVLGADFGEKRKLMFASFPHEEMVRWITAAAQAGWVTIYDARDDWEEFEKVGMAKWYDRGFETYVGRSCDVVTAISRPLARKLAAMTGRDDIHVVPNALDPAFPSAPGGRAPSDPPVIGYFGHLTSKWFDWDLVIQAARAYPTWRFELAGHQEPDGLKLPDNVVMLGLRGHAELAELSSRWSAAIIPFQVSALGEAVDPIKVYEYLHLGLPTLSSYMPQMRDYPGVVVTESAPEFVASLETVARMQLDEAAVREWLAVNRWPDRVNRYSELAREAASRPRRGFDALLGGRPG